MNRCEEEEEPCDWSHESNVGAALETLMAAWARVFLAAQLAQAELDRHHLATELIRDIERLEQHRIGPKKDASGWRCSCDTCSRIYDVFDFFGGALELPLL